MRIITHSIRARVLVLVVSVSILPLIVVASLLIVRMYQNDRATSQLVQDATNAQASIYVTTFVDQADRELRRIVQIPTLLTTTTENQETLLAQALFSTPLFAAVRLVDGQGRERVHSTRLGRVAPQVSPIVTTTDILIGFLQNNTSFYGPVLWDADTNEWLLRMIVPTLDATTGQPDGMVVGDLRLSALLATIATIVRPAGGSISLVTDQGLVITDPQSRSTQPPIPLTSDTTTTLRLPTGQNISRTQQPIRLKNLTLYVVADLPLEAVQTTALKAAGTSSLVIGGTLLVAIILSVLAVQSMMNPIRQLATATHAISNGDLSQTLVVSRHDELGLLAQAFNRMTDTVRNTIATLDQRVADRTTELEHVLQEREQHLGALQTALQARDDLAAVIRQISSPLLPITDEVYVMPLVGLIDPQRVTTILTALLTLLDTVRPRIVILDITALPLVDQTVTDMLVHASQVAAILGTLVMVVGIRPDVAQTLVTFHDALATLRIYPTLEGAIAAATQRVMEGRHGSR